MKNFLSFLVLLVSILFVEINNETVYAFSIDAETYFEEHSRRVGYKTVNEAVKEFEYQCNCKVGFPTMIPDLKFTHEFGTFYGSEENGVNSLLEIRFVNRKMRDNIFQIDIRSNKLDFEGEEHTLQDGSKGIYFVNQIFDFFCL